jgi:transposase
MEKISITGLDLAKQVFQVHAADSKGRCVLRKQLKRREVLAFFAKLTPCVVAMEACGTAHYWAREIAKLGHETRLVPPAYAKAYVKRGKNDAIDAEAICEAAGRPSMRFVPVKSVEGQALAMLHRSRDLSIKNRTMLVNALRSHLAEFGFVAAKGIGKLPDLIKIVSEAPREALPDMVRATLSGFLDAIAALNLHLAAIEKRLRAWHKSDAKSQRLASAPGIGLIGATALCALVPDPSLFKNGRHLAAWLGLTPREHSTGGKTRLKRISKAGDGYLRRLLVLGATSLLRSLANKTTPLALWTQGLLARRPRRLVTVALANKLARIAWAVMAKAEAYKPLAAAQTANA